MEHKQLNLPYEENALEPVMSKETIEFHFGKHYNAYCTNFKKLIEENPQFKDACISEVIQDSEGGLFNNAAQVVNHELFFEQFSANGKKEPDGALLDAINHSFNSFDEMKKLMTAKSVGLFGSGWVWLALDGKNLVIAEGSNAYNPLVEYMRPLLAIDVWEHAYYLDYQNRRPDYIENLWKIIDWDIISKRYSVEIETC